MTSKFEQLIEYVINDEEAKAQELFHDIVVEKSREIYENLMNEEDSEEEDAEEIRGIYEEERESQLDYRAVLVPDDLPEDENSVNEYVDSLDKKDEE